MDGFWVIFRNSSGCELERRWARTEDQLSEVWSDFALEVAATICVGDTLSVEEGWTEIPENEDTDNLVE